MKLVLHTGLNVHRASSGGSQFVTNSLLVCYKGSQTGSTTYTHLIFSVTLIKVCSIPIQNIMHCWWIEIRGCPKYKLYDNIGDFSKTKFWYHSYDTKRNPWVLRVKRFIYQVMMYSKNFITSTLHDIDPVVFSERG